MYSQPASQLRRPPALYIHITYVSVFFLQALFGVAGARLFLYNHSKLILYIVLANNECAQPCLLDHTHSACTVNYYYYIHPALPVFVSLYLLYAV